MTEEIENEEKPMFLTCNVTQESSKDIWFLDSTCSNHMIGNKELFSSIDTNIQSEVKLGNACKIKVNGKGVIVVYAKNGEKRTIHDVYYVPSLMCNLLCWTIAGEEYRLFFKKKLCTIYDRYPSKQLISRVDMTKNRIFPLTMRNDLTKSLNAYKTKSLDQSWLWHFRYRHLHFGGLDLLQKSRW